MAKGKADSYGSDAKAKADAMKEKGDAMTHKAKEKAESYGSDKE